MFRNLGRDLRNKIYPSNYYRKVDRKPVVTRKFSRNVHSRRIYMYGIRKAGTDRQPAPENGVDLWRRFLERV